MQAPEITFVDGFLIRNTLLDDFGIVESHSHDIAVAAPKFWIPEGEIWVDYRYKDEASFLVEVDAFTAPTATENYAERRRLAVEKFCTPPTNTDYLLHSEQQEGFTLRFVDGAKVRRGFDPDFILGGHDRVYVYIPQDEIWLDNKMDPRESQYILLHEVVEWKLMKQGKPYHVAHEFATASDMEARRRDGARYPGDPEYEWHGHSNRDIIKKYYV